MAKSFLQVTIFKWFDVVLGICLQREQAYSIFLDNQSLYEMLAGGERPRSFWVCCFHVMPAPKLYIHCTLSCEQDLTFQLLSPTMTVFSFLSVPLCQLVPALTSIAFIFTFFFTLSKPYPCPTDFTMACFFFTNQVSLKSYLLCQIHWIFPSRWHYSWIRIWLQTLTPSTSTLCTLKWTEMNSIS